MDEQQIKQLMDDCTLPDTCRNRELKTTHISWVILTDHYAFKIKRPVQYSFVDFSTIEKREYYCHEEIRLNRRLAPEMYLGVLPVTAKMAGLDQEGDKTIDFAVRMQRKDSNKQMDRLMDQGRVDKDQIESLVKKIVDFHKSAEPVKNVFDTLGLQREYEDILTEKEQVKNVFGDSYEDKIKHAVEISSHYLNAIRSYSNERVISGFRKDCHGDLNARNIFLYDDPVIFDCIEFNRKFREIDILNDIAFLAVDFDFFDRSDLGEYFYERYLEDFGLEDEPKSKTLFIYYKSYRANIRAKVNLIRSVKDKVDARTKSLKKAKKYIDLMHLYTQMVDQG
ncbi:MAG: hypothetical protein K9G67_13990 [Bacteroidales bacterium]|nr:hypothetical protein [Bacteroidales bacterium]MCF8352724.1 hypothetical protein [Bacteroidales bacterium]MCF8377463.1 hypothetical protein [Bacteroidales bacterium]MCF8401586.1 hypothetical protein [Bacteroidales bacterium]